MKFTKLVDLVEESHRIELVEESWRNIFSSVRNILIVAGLLGIAHTTYTIPKLKQIIQQELQQHPEKIQEIEQRLAEVEKQQQAAFPKVQNVNEPVSPQKPVQPAEAPIPAKQKVDNKVGGLSPQFIATLRKHLIEKEGVRNKVYGDIYGYPTIGVGHYIIPDDITNGLFSPKEVWKNKDGSYAGQITNDRIEQILMHDIRDKYTRITRANQFPDFDTYPDTLKMIIFDGFFRGDLSGSPNTKKHLRDAVRFLKRAVERKSSPTLNLAKQKLKMAANEYLDNKEYRASVKSKSGVYKRMNENAKKMIHAFDGITL